MLGDRAIHEQVLVVVCRELGMGIGSVGVRVEHGVVMLSGVVDTPAERSTVERAVWGVPDVRAIVQRIRVRRTYDDGPTDTALATAVLEVLNREGWTNSRVRVEEGRVNVTRPFHSAAERDAVAAAVATVPGVCGVWVADEPAALARP